MGFIKDEEGDYGLEQTSLFLAEFATATQEGAVKDHQLTELLFRVRTLQSPFTTQQRHDILEGLQKAAVDEDLFAIAETKLYVVQYICGTQAEIEQAQQDAREAIKRLPYAKRYDAYGSLIASTQGNEELQQTLYKAQFGLIDTLPEERQKDALHFFASFGMDTMIGEEAQDKLRVFPERPRAPQGIDLSGFLKSLVGTAPQPA